MKLNEYLFIVFNQGIEPEHDPHQLDQHHICRMVFPRMLTFVLNDLLLFVLGELTRISNNDKLKEGKGRSKIIRFDNTKPMCIVLCCFLQHDDESHHSDNE